MPGNADEGRAARRCGSGTAAGRVRLISRSPQRGQRPCRRGGATISVSRWPSCGFTSPVSAAISGLSPRRRSSCSRPGPRTRRAGLGEELRALALISLGVAELGLRDSTKPKGTLSGVSLWRAGSGGPSWRSAAWRTGEWPRVLRLPLVERGRQAIELARRHGWGGEPLVAIAYPMLAGSLIWQGELEEAERWLMEGNMRSRPRSSHDRNAVPSGSSGSRDRPRPCRGGASRPVCRRAPARTAAHRSAGDRPRALCVGEHGPDAHAAPVRQARSPTAAWRSSTGPWCSWPARARPAKGRTDLCRAHPSLALDVRPRRAEKRTSGSTSCRRRPVSAWFIIQAVQCH